MESCRHDSAAAWKQHIKLSQAFQKTASTQTQPARWRRWRSCRSRRNFRVIWRGARRFRWWFRENLSAGCFIVSSFWLQRSVWFGQHVSNTCPLDVCWTCVWQVSAPCGSRSLLCNTWLHSGSINWFRIWQLVWCLCIHICFYTLHANIACQCQHVLMDFFVDLTSHFIKV